MTYIHEQNRWTVTTGMDDDSRSKSYWNGQPTSFIIMAKTYDQLKKILENLKIEKRVDKLIVIFWMPLENPLELVSEILQPVVNMKINFKIIVPDSTNRTRYIVHSCKPTCDGPRPNKIIYCSFGKFYNNSYIPPKKTSPKNCPISAVYSQNKPLTYIPEGKSEMEGIEAKLMKTIISKLNLTVEYIPTQTFGVVHPNGTSTGGFRFLQNGSADVLFGSYALTEVRSRYFQTTTVYFFSEISWCAPRKLTIAYHKVFKDAVDIFLIATAGALCMCVSLFIWWAGNLERRESTTYSHFSNSLLNTLSVVLGVAVRMLPKSGTVRVIMGSLITTALILNVFYSSHLASQLTSTKNHVRYDTLTGIYEDNLTTYTTTTMMPHIQTYKPTYHFEVGVEEMFKNFTPCHNVSRCLEEISERGSVLFLPKHSRDYLFNKMKVARMSSIYCSDDCVMKFPLVVYVRRGFPLTEAFNRIIDRVISSGLMTKWRYEVTGNKLKFKIDPNQNIIKLSHLESVFMLYLWANALAVLVFVGELIIGRGRKIICFRR